MRLQRWLYRDGRPNRVARLLDRITAAVYARGVSPDYLVTLAVRGRRSGRTIRFPLVMITLDGERFLVSMLGKRVNWVRNVKAAGGKAVVRHGRIEAVRLEPVPVDQRAPVLARYVERAPNARAHLPLAPGSSDAAFARVADRIPVFRVVPRSAAGSH